MERPGATGSCAGRTSWTFEATSSWHPRAQASGYTQDAESDAADGRTTGSRIRRPPRSTSGRADPHGSAEATYGNALTGNVPAFGTSTASWRTTTSVSRRAMRLPVESHSTPALASLLSGDRFSPLGVLEARRCFGDVPIVRRGGGPSWSLCC